MPINREVLKDNCIFSTKKNPIANKKTYWVINDIIGDQNKCTNLRIGIFVNNDVPNFICSMQSDNENFLNLFVNLPTMEESLKQYDQFHIDFNLLRKLIQDIGR